MIRPQFPGDAVAVANVHRAAFGRDVEPDLASRLLREGDVLPSSRVLVLDGDVVGSAVASRAWVGEREVVALGPVGVLPPYQRRGIGSTLVRAVLAAASDAPLVALLGSPGYYSRFGFVADSRVTPPKPEWGEHFQVFRYDAEVEGAFRYARAFDDVSD